MIVSNKQSLFVSGATGFIGRRLCLELALKGHRVHALCRDTGHPNLIRHENIVAVKGDILDVESLRKTMKGCDQVYHTAAMAKMWCRNPLDFYQVNVIGTRNVLEVCMEMGVKKVVYTSTCGVLGPTIKHPMTESDPRMAGFPIDYERTKYLAELEVNGFVKLGLPVTMVHPSRVFGEGPVTDSNTVSKMIRGYLKGSSRIIPGNGERIANYAFLDDVVWGHMAAMDKGLAGHRYILGGEDLSFSAFFNTLAEVSGKDYEMIRVPQKLIKLYSYLEAFKTRLTGFPPVFLPEFADRLNYDQKYSSQKAIEHLNYRITPFAEALERTVKYLKNNTL
jgi:dihydroflavonol-4-reductase/farnesol dehydrogenase